MTNREFIGTFSDLSSSLQLVDMHRTGKESHGKVWVIYRGLGNERRDMLHFIS